MHSIDVQKFVYECNMQCMFFIFLIKVFKNHIVVLLNLANPDLKWVVLSSQRGTK